MESLKICLVTGQYPPQIGGVGHSAKRVARLLAEAGHTIHVVAFIKHPKPLPFDESFNTTKEDGITVHRVRVYHPPGPANAEVLTRYNREMFQALDYFYQRHRYHLFHAFFLYPAAYIAGMVGKLHALPVMVSIRGNDVGKYIFDPLRVHFIRTALENATYVTSVSTNLIEIADRTLVPVQHKAKTILNSIDVEQLRPVKTPALQLKGTVIGTAGLFRYKKGLVYLFKALSTLKSEFDFTLLLVGDFFSAEERQQHMNMLERLQLLSNTVITGKIQQEKMADYLQFIDIAVFPSLYSEGCPLSMLETMAMKKAIIASKSGAIPEIIRDGYNGLLVYPGQADEISAALRKLLMDPELRRFLAENAWHTARQMTPQKEREAWLSAYQECLFR